MEVAVISAVAGIITALHACVELVRRAKEGRSLNPFTSEARATRRERDTREYLCKQLLASLEEALQDFQKRTKNDLRNYGRLFAQGDDETGQILRSILETLETRVLQELRQQSRDVNIAIMINVLESSRVQGSEVMKHLHERLERENTRFEHLTAEQYGIASSIPGIMPPPPPPPERRYQSEPDDRIEPLEVVGPDDKIEASPIVQPDDRIGSPPIKVEYSTKVEPLLKTSIGAPQKPVPPTSSKIRGPPKPVLASSSKIRVPPKSVPTSSSKIRVPPKPPPPTSKIRVPPKRPAGKANTTKLKQEEPPSQDPSRKKRSSWLSLFSRPSPSGSSTSTQQSKQYEKGALTMALYMLCKLGYHTLSENLLVFDLLRLGADPSYAEAHDGSVLIWSILNRTHHETLAILDASADVNRMAGPWVSCSPLAAAGAKGDTYILKELIDRGADLTGYNGHCAIEGVRNAEFASTCYTTARQRQRGEKFLREHGAKIDGETEGCLVM